MHHSLSPELHTHLLEENNLSGKYERLQTEYVQFDERVDYLIKKDYTGFNITIPFKMNIIGYLAEISDNAAQIGAVNTVKIIDGRLFGFNTDGIGFIRALANKNVEIKNSSVTVLGAGGAARAVIFSLIKNGISQLTIINRSEQRALALIQDIRKLGRFSETKYVAWQQDNIKEVCQKTDILINSTSIGMWPNIDDTPFFFEDELDDFVVVDLVYNPLKTAFLKMAKNKSALCVDGLDMFIYQGVEALQIWFGQEIKFDYEKLRRMLIEKLENYGRN